MKRIYLEITNSCNLNCIFCTHKKGNDFIDINLIENLLIQIKKYTSYIYLHVLGEPLLHPNFKEIITLLNKYDFKLQLVTNGLLLKDHLYILNSNCLRKLAISIHSIDNVDVTNNYFDTLDQIINSNTDKIIDLRFYELNNLNNNALNYYNKICKNFILQPTKNKYCYKIKNNTYLSINPFFKWPDINDPYISDIGKCLGGIDMIAIKSNLDVCMCCLDCNNDTKIGNLKQFNLDYILESDLYKKHVNNITCHKLTFELCKRCSYRLRFK